MVVQVLMVKMRCNDHLVFIRKQTLRKFKSAFMSNLRCCFKIFEGLHQVIGKNGIFAPGFSENLLRKKADKDTLTKKEVESNRSEAAKREWAEFSEKYPDVKSNELFDNEEFMAFADGKFGAKTLLEIYEAYNTFISKYRKEADKKAARIMANAKASPGALATANGSTEQYYTREQVDKMSYDEVKRNYEVIRKSMAKWK